MQLLPQDVFYDTLTFLSLDDALAAIPRTCRKFRDRAYADPLWAHWGQKYFGLSLNRDGFLATAGNLNVLRRLDIYLETRNLIDKFRQTVTALGVPEIAASLDINPAPAPLIAQVEREYGAALPDDLACLYACTAGQRMEQLIPNRPIARHHDEAHWDVTAPLEPELCGMFGGYRSYDHIVNFHFPHIEEVARLRHEFAVPLAFSYRSNAVMMVLVDDEGTTMRRGQVIAFTGNGHPMLVADSTLGFLREWITGLQTGMYKPYRKELCRFPMSGPGTFRAVTNGIHVEATPLLIPEQCILNPPRYFYAYRVRMWSPEGSGVAPCQLKSRRWVIHRGANLAPEIVEGDGVIGLYPKIKEGCEVFEYCSCTHYTTTYGTMEGSFTMVPGTLRNPRPGEAPFDVTVPRFLCTYDIETILKNTRLHNY